MDLNRDHNREVGCAATHALRSFTPGEGEEDSTEPYLKLKQYLQYQYHCGRFGRPLADADERHALAVMISTVVGHKQGFRDEWTKELMRKV